MAEEIKNQGQQENAENLNENVSGQAKEIISAAWNFYQQIAFDGKSGNKARILEFDVERPIQQDGKMTTMSQSVKAPFIGLVPIPSLLIDRVDVDFQMEVTDTSNAKSTTNAEVEAEASADRRSV